MANDRKMVALTKNAKSLLDLYIGMMRSLGVEMTISESIESMLETHFINNPDQLEIAEKAAMEDANQELKQRVAALANVREQLKKPRMATRVVVTADDLDRAGRSSKSNDAKN